MHTQGPTHTLLEAQDIRTTANFRAAPLPERRERAAPPARLPHDFLVLSPRPDLTPQLFERA